MSEIKDINSEKKLKCLYCGIQNLNFQYHEIFDEIGQQLQLQTLAAQYLDLKVTHKPTGGEQQVLCDECVNYLISLFDIDELKKQRTENAAPTAAVKRKISVSPPSKVKVLNAGLAKTTPDLQIKEPKPNTVAAKRIKDVAQQDIDSSNATAKVAQCKETKKTSTSTQDKISALISEIVGDNIEFMSDDYAAPKSATTSSTDDVEEVVIEEEELTQQQEADYSNNSETKQLRIQIIGNDDKTIKLDFEGMSDEEHVDYTNNDDEQSVETQDEFKLFALLPLADDNDATNLNDYLDSALTSKLETLQFQWATTCKHCSMEFTTFEQLLAHMQQTHQMPNQCYNCPNTDCQSKLQSVKTLARHLVLRHSALHDLPIYSCCPACNKTFSNFVRFNKHSCARMIKRRRGMRWSCEMCNIDFRTMKRFVFHMQFHLEKHRPRACLICDYTSNNIEELFEHVHYNHELENALACKICDRFFRDNTTFSEHKHQDVPIGIYDCRQCQKSFVSRSRLVTHLKQSHGSYYKCDFCAKEFAKEATYKLHLKTHVETEVNAYVCNKCGLIDIEYENLMSHLQKNKSDCLNAGIEPDTLSVAYICEYCSQNYKTKDDLKNHRASGIHNDGKYSCTCCNNVFESMRLYRNHTKAKMSTTTKWLRENICCLFMCDAKNGCSETYGMWNSLYTHKRRTHEGIRGNDSITTKATDEKTEFICQFCQKICPTKMSLSVHVGRKHNNNNLCCNECGASYKNKDALQKHIDFVHVRIECADCGKLLKNQRNYEVHRRVVHLAEKRYNCEICQKGFFQRSDKEQHEKMHKETFKCKECTFVTHYANSMQVHVARMHRHEFEYKCPHCERDFARKTALNVHIKRRHKTRKENSDLSANIVRVESNKMNTTRNLRSEKTTKRSVKRAQQTLLELDDDCEYLDEEYIVENCVEIDAEDDDDDDVENEINDDTNDENDEDEDDIAEIETDNVDECKFVLLKKKKTTK